MSVFLAIAWCGLGAELATPADAGAPQGVAAAMATLLEGARVRNAADVSQSVCLDDMARGQFQRRRALGMVDADAEASFVSDFRIRYVQTVYDWYDQLMRDGSTMQDVDVSRLEGPSSPTESAAIGLIGLTVAPSGRTVDVSTVRQGDRWCLEPVVLP